MTKAIYVVGHKNPDTDSICAAIAYAKLKQRLGYPAIPCRAGAINEETRFVLDYFKVEVPRLLPDLHTRARDLLNGNGGCTVVQPDIPVWEAWKLMRARKIKTLPVVDEGNHLLGLVTVGDFADKYLADLGEKDLGHICATVSNVVQTLSGTLLVGNPAQELNGTGLIGAMETETMEKYLCPDCILIVGDREKIQLAALKKGAACLILTGGAALSPAVREEAVQRGATVIGVPMDTFTAARMLLMSIPVGAIMHTTDLVVFQEDDLLDEVRKVMLNTRFRNYPVVDEQNRVVGEIARYHLLGFSKKPVILVDHNELSQAVEGAEEAQILEVVDHHRVGGIQTGEPILFRNEPVGSTCTLIAKAYLEHGIEPSLEIAGILCAGILSDTVVFKSPTCTQVDRDMAAMLGKLAGIDPVQFGITMFKKTSSLMGRSPREIVASDYKKFLVGDLQFGIGQVSVLGLEGMDELKESLLQEMEGVRKSEGADYVLLMVTDLIEEATYLLISGPNPELVGEAYQAEVRENAVYLPGVLSRKKQVVPPLIKYFQQ